LSREGDSHTPDNHSDGSNAWPEAIDYLRLLRTEYQGARKQLEEVTGLLGQREAEIDFHLRQAVLFSSHYRPLCLVSVGDSSTFSLMGNTILGDSTPFRVLPKVMRLDVRLLGQFEVSSSSRRLERWQSAKAKSLLQYLMIKPKLPVIKDVLMENLWPNADPELAGNNLKSAVYSLRKTLGSLFYDEANFPYIVFLQGTYLINPSIELWADIEEFEKHWTTGRRLEKEGAIREAASHFESAEELYRGDYLEDEPYEDWVINRREAIKDTYLAVLSKLADYSIFNSDYESCIIYCQKILGKDPCREDVYRRLICAHSRLGRRNRAIEWYRICRETIWSELSAIPEKETVDLYQKLLRNEPI
jgi:LuxR family maltose regulon positive regulatory protein